MLIGNKDFKWFVIERDQAEIDALMKAEADFWPHVTEDVPPLPDGSDATSEAVGTIWKESVHSHVDLFGRESMVQEYFRLKATTKELDARTKEIENILKMDMGTADRAFCGNYKVTWKTQERSLFDKEAFAKANPEIDLRPYYKTSTSRPFKLTEMTTKN